MGMMQGGGYQPARNVLMMPADTMTQDRNLHLSKVMQASNKQLEMFKRAQETMQNQPLLPKERLMQVYMQAANNANQFGPGGSPKNAPFGKVVS